MTAGSGLDLDDRPDIRRSDDVARLRGLLVLAEILVRDVEQLRARRIRGGLPVLAARGGGTDVAHHGARSLQLVGCVVQRTRLEVDAGGRIDRHERRCRQHLAARAVHHVDVAVAIGMDEDLARLSIDHEVDEYALVHRVIVEFVVRAQLIEPSRLSRRRVAREESRGELVVAGPLLGVPWSGIGQCRSRRDRDPHRRRSSPTPCRRRSSTRPKAMS